ncbi:unnamed protein product, partial [Adineta steineri]
ERRQLERERDFEKDKVIEIQNSLNTTSRRYSELQIEYDRIKDHSSVEVQTLRQENKTLKDNAREFENKVYELTRRNDEFKSKVSNYEYRIQDTDSVDKRNRNEIVKLQRDIQELLREKDDYTREVNEWKRKYESVKTDLSTIQYEREQVEVENQNINQQNAQLKHEMDELSIQIRLQIQVEYEEKYRQITTRTENEIQNVQNENETIRYDLEEMSRERARVADRLQTVEYSLKQANETINTYEVDIKRLKQELNIVRDKNDDIEREISRTYTSELKIKTDRLQDFENKYRLVETQLIQYERTINELRQDKNKLIESNDKYQREYDRYRLDQQKIAEYIATIDDLEVQLRERDNLIKKLQYEPEDIRLKFEIRIEQLEQEIERQEHSIQTYTHTIREKDRDIENLKRVDSDNIHTIQVLQKEVHTRDQRIEQVANDKKFDITEYQRNISELQGIIRDREREIVDLDHSLKQNSEAQQRELINYRYAAEKNEIYLQEIKTLKKQLQEIPNPNTTSQQIHHLQTIIEDFKLQLRQREDSIQGLQHTIADCDKELKEVHHTYNTVQNDYNRIELRYEQMEKQYKADLDIRDQTIDSLRKQIAVKTYEKVGAPAPTDSSWKLELQKRDDLINELKQKLDNAIRVQSSTNQHISSSIQYARPVQIHTRPQLKNYAHLNREELQYELDMALQLNEELNQQLAQKSPNITELHNQVIVIRKELARQKYVNQVLWRKLDALIDIYGSNTRAELAIELANYQNEIETL